jgi:large subunit ribosomal protein L17
MRHRKAGVKLNRTTSHRQAMFKNMVTSLFKHDRIRTTDVKAKELKRWADHVITLAKRGDLHARRQVLAIVQERDVVQKLFKEAGERFGKQNGGYTRIVKIGRRPGDAAPVSIIELISSDGGIKTSKKKTKRASKKKDDLKTKTTDTTAKDENTSQTDVDVAKSQASVESGGDASGNDATSTDADQTAEATSEQEEVGTDVESSLEKDQADSEDVSEKK